MSPKKEQQPKKPAEPAPPAKEDVSNSNASLDAADEDAPVEEMQGTAGQANKEMKDISSAFESAAARVSDSAVTKGTTFIAQQAAQLKTEKANRDKELAKIALKKEDVDVVMAELDMSKAVAERVLREHNGSLEATLRAIIAV
ncbi:hypothetical protein HDV05_003095 [Chytridiales sp. JEL 0842]|nr:hypothetical protein HDV05_003095 [Chytridiales sp. JEL 0842]